MGVAFCFQHIPKLGTFSVFGINVLGNSQIGKD
jgi:hypothetical protein